MNKARWTKKQIKILKEKYELTPSKELKILIHKSRVAINNKARRLGLKKPSNHDTKYLLKTLKPKKFRKSKFAYFICGFVAGEGSFNIAKYKTRKRFAFEIQLANDDNNILIEIKNYFKVGNIFTYPPRKKTWKGTTSYVVEDYRGLLESIIPFFDMFGLRNTKKQKQYLQWKKKLISYIENRK